jgi:hypothetical protein
MVIHTKAGRRVVAWKRLLLIAASSGPKIDIWYAFD